MSREQPKEPKAVPEGADQALRSEELKRAGKLDPAERYRRRGAESTGQELLGHNQSLHGPDIDPADDDELEPPDHPTRDSE